MKLGSAFAGSWGFMYDSAKRPNLRQQALLLLWLNTLTSLMVSCNWVGELVSDKPKFALAGQVVDSQLKPIKEATIYV